MPNEDVSTFAILQYADARYAMNVACLEQQHYLKELC